MMEQKGTCLQTYIPMRSEPSPAAEMVSSIVFGESYTVLQTKQGFLEIETDYDHYKGWISANTFEPYQAFNAVCDALFLEAKSNHEFLLIPCGAILPESGSFERHGKTFKLANDLKPTHHLPLSFSLQSLAQKFLNVPYLWGGRCFMGIDCSGFIQMVFKAHNIALPRDTSQQINCGKAVEYAQAKPCDLVFFSKPETDKVSHVGLLLDKHKIIHASGVVKIDDLSPNGIQSEQGLIYKTVAIRSVI